MIPRSKTVKVDVNYSAIMPDTATSALILASENTTFRFGLSGVYLHVYFTSVTFRTGYTVVHGLQYIMTCSKNVIQNVPVALFPTLF